MRRLLCLTALVLLALITSRQLASAQSPVREADRRRVIAMLQEPVSGSMPDIARTRGPALAALPFDGIAVSHELIADDNLGSDAAYAMLGADESRALRLLFQSVPTSGPNVQRIAFTWFLDRYASQSPIVSAEARGAALRTLDPVRSTAHAEAALYVLGLTGNPADTSLLEFFSTNVRTGSQGMRDASVASLARLGSVPHLDRLRLVLERPLPAGSTYREGLAVAAALQKAAFAAHPSLVAPVCGHINDMPLGNLEFRLDTGRSAQLALNAIVDRVSVTHLSTGTRSPDEWATYCENVTPSPR
mgnify:FL=1